MYNFNTTYTQLHPDLFSSCRLPTLKHAQIILKHTELQKALGLGNISSKTIFKIDKDTQPFAQAYAGHQFGHFTMLGDGRALILGEHVTPGNKRFDIQVKGSGVTPYSRGGDGKATVNSMMREYMYSYAMEKLGIPTAKSLAVIKTHESVIRDEIEDGAMLIRVMSSHIRFGTFEFASKYLQKKDFTSFVDYVIKRHYPKILESKNVYREFYRKVIQKTIEMVVEWYRVGFIHGVMNTDNMSVVGKTFDYGPCAFMNTYDPQKTFSKIDVYKRYSFENQKHILKWNLFIFAQTLLPLVKSEELQNEFDTFDSLFDTSYMEMMKKKLGIISHGDFGSLIHEFLNFLEHNQLDYTNSFIALQNPHAYSDSVYQSEDFQKLRSKIQKVGLDKETMTESDPRRILRNYILEEALDEYVYNKDMSKIITLLEALREPYKENNGFRVFEKPPSDDFEKQYKTHCNT
ncbi:MAG: protein adenylyltransferase SelO family protein [Candidatus Woesearchaeota archaeon]